MDELTRLKIHWDNAERVRNKMVRNLEVATAGLDRAVKCLANANEEAGKAAVAWAEASAREERRRRLAFFGSGGTGCQDGNSEKK